MLGKAIWRLRIQENLSTAGAPPRTPLRELTALPQRWGRLAVPSPRTPSPRSRPFGPRLSYPPLQNKFRRRWCRQSSLCLSSCRCVSRNLLYCTLNHQEDCSRSSRSSRRKRSNAKSVEAWWTDNVETTVLTYLLTYLLSYLFIYLLIYSNSESSMVKQCWCKQ